ncbi:MAG: hypothetical protein GY795_12370 [Desulfobacterales bacterium]|nr:hypothetical protein [Desulfobacterales bacterium]
MTQLTPLEETTVAGREIILVTKEKPGEKTLHEEPNRKNKGPNSQKISCSWNRSEQKKENWLVKSGLYNAFKNTLKLPKENLFKKLWKN